MRETTVRTDRIIVVVLSTMRSGSTLLKALLAEAPDVSNLSEVDFQKYWRPEAARAEIEMLHNAPIIVLKRPAWYSEVGSYPRLPAVDELKQIVLVRDAYETICSLKKMTFGRFPSVLGSGFNTLLLSYWIRVTRDLLQLRDRNASSTELVRYEDLVADPIDQTHKLFQFVGSAQEQGVDQYGQPQSFEWKWGQDDGGPKIRQLRVIPPGPNKYNDRRLANIIRHSRFANAIRQRLGYPELSRADL